jgi:hypothetical protein
MKRDANNLLSMLRTWQLNDVGATPGFGGSLERALTSIRAKASVMASQTDPVLQTDRHGSRGRFDSRRSISGPITLGPHGQRRDQSAGLRVPLRRNKGSIGRMT